MTVKADRIEREKEGWKRKVEQSEADVTARLHATEQQKEQSTVTQVAVREQPARDGGEAAGRRKRQCAPSPTRVEQLDKEIARVKERLAEAEKEAVPSAPSTGS